MNAEYYSQCIQTLRAYEVAHRNFECAKQALYTHTSLATPGSVIVFVGPTRSGKTTLLQYIRQSLVTQAIDSNPDYMPLVTVDAANAHDGLFSMKHLTLRMLDAIKHPIFKDVGAAVEAKQYFPRVRLSETYLRIALEKALLVRKTRYLVIDEAGHLVIGRRKSRASEVLDSLKSLCNTTNIVLVLIGGYSLLSNLFASAHLNGRMRVLTLRDYKDNRSDRNEFARILATLDGLVPLRRGATLLDLDDDLYAGSLGLYGLLVNWIEAAICAMAADGARYLDKKYLAETRLEQQIQAISEEIDLGDAFLVRHAVHSVPFNAPMKSTAKSERTNKREIISGTPSTGKKRRPFQRKPSRDKVGGQPTGKAGV